MCDNFTSYFVEDATICFKFYFPNSFPETEKLKISNGDETVLGEQVISIFGAVAFVTQFFKSTHITNHSPSFKNISK
jgi:hypothetical protein